MIKINISNINILGHITYKLKNRSDYFLIHGLSVLVLHGLLDIRA